jgi:hypothetical protein
MKELALKYLRAALDKEGLAHTFVESPGDHPSHLREGTTEVLKFLSAPRTCVQAKITFSVGKEVTPYKSQ